MLNFFDYIFYRVCKAYSKTADSSPTGAASAIVSLMQIQNIFSVLMLVELLIQKKSILNKPIGISVIFFLLVFNYIRYIYKENNDYKVLQLKWTNDKQEIKRGALVLAYIVLSTIICFVLAIYLGSKPW